MKKLVCIIVLLINLNAYSQDAAGYWYGVAKAGTGAANNYLVELILKQNGTQIQGVVNYYFKNTFRSFKTSGYYNSSSRAMRS